MNPVPFLPVWLVTSTLHCSGAILLVCLLRVAVRRWLGAQAAQLLWLIVLLQMGAPWLPYSPLGWRRDFPAGRGNAPETAAETRITVSVADAPGPARPGPRGGAPSRPPGHGWPLRLWALGAGGVLGLALFRAWRAGRLVQRAREVPVAEWEPVLRAGGWGRVPWRVRETSELHSPALCGLWRPVVLLPAGWRTQFTAVELRCVLAHELGHLRRGDLWWRWAFLLASAVHWFNPLVWLAARLAHRDQEMACDEWVTTRPGFVGVELYGETLLKAVRRAGTPGLASPVQVGMAESKAGLAARLRRLASARAPARFAGAFSSGFILLACAFLGPAPRAAEPEVAKTPAPPRPEQPAAPVTAPTPAAPAAPVAVPTSGKETFVQIESKFVEVSGEARTVNEFMAKTLPHPGKGGSTQWQSVFSETEFADVLIRLHQMKDIDLLSAPRVTTHAGQRAVIEIVREFRYPTIFEPGKNRAENATPAQFATRNVGVTLEALPEIAPDGSIDLTLIPTVVEFAGFINYGAGRPARATGTDPLEEMMRSRPATRTEQVINQPIFETRRLTTSGNLRSGQTLLLGSITRKDTQTVEDGSPGKRQTSTREIQRLLFIFVTAKLTDTPGPEAAKSGPPAATPEAAKASPPPSTKGWPYAVPVPGKPGFVTSPYAPDKGYIDLRGFPPDTEVQCPYSEKIFLTPQLQGAE